MNFFDSSSSVKTKDGLFGWNASEDFLDALLSMLTKSFSNIEILGERRSGKTSILNCINSELLKNVNKNKLIPVIVNFSSHRDNIDSSNAFNLFSASILNTLDKIDELSMNESYELKGKVIKRNRGINDYLSDLENLSKIKTKAYFKDLVADIAEEGFSVVVLIDEYESMFSDVLQGKRGSAYALRDLCDAELPNNQKFRCSYTGNRRWSDYYSKNGSDDFNFINETQFIPSFNFEQCNDLIVYGFKKLKVLIKNNLIREIFSLSGGSPFLIKSICNSYLRTGKVDKDYLGQKLQSTFESLWSRLSVDFQLALKGESQNFGIRDYCRKLNLLEERKILFKTNFFPKGDLWKDFLKNKSIDKEKIDFQFEKTDEEVLIEDKVRERGTKTCELYQKIQDHLYAKNLDIIFDFKLSHKYVTYVQRLHSPSTSKELFKDFIAALYIIIFESTQRFIIDVTPRNDENHSLLNNIIDLINKNNNLSISKHPIENRYYFSTDRKKIDKLIGELKKKENIKIFTKITKTPMNMASLPPEFNRYPNKNNCPDVFHRIDVLRHLFIEAHDVFSQNFENRRFTPHETIEYYLGYFNDIDEISKDEYCDMQLKILHELNKSLSLILQWAKKQKSKDTSYNQSATLP